MWPNIAIVLSNRTKHTRETKSQITLNKIYNVCSGFYVGVDLKSAPGSFISLQHPLLELTDMSGQPLTATPPGMAQ